MLSRDTYPSNIASLLLALTLFVLAPGNLKTIKIKAHTGSRGSEVVPALKLFLGVTSPTALFLMPQILLISTGHYVHQSAYLSLNLATLSSTLCSNLYLQTWVWQIKGKKTLLVCGNCGSWQLRFIAVLGKWIKKEENK